MTNLRAPRRLSDELMAEFENMILAGVLKAGEKLPPERELAARFQVSRPSIREALQKLAARGLVNTRQGGGTYVSDSMGEAFSDPLTALLERHPDVHGDLLEYRLAIEGASAYYAALRATDEDRDQLSTRYQALLAAHGSVELADEGAADASFHLVIAQSSHNVVLYHTTKGLFDLLRRNVITNIGGLYLRGDTRDRILEQHTAIYEAIMESKPDSAQQASHQHLRYVQTVLMEMEQEARRLTRLQRLRNIHDDHQTE